MKLAKKLGIGAAGILIGLAGIGLPNAAQALVFNFTYDDFNYDGFRSANITITTTDTTNAFGQYTITGVSGTRTLGATTRTIIALLPPGGYGGNDNLWNPSSPFLTSSGFSFQLSGNASTANINLYYDSAIGSYREVSTAGNNLVDSSLDAPEGVPEPSDIGGLAILLGMGGLMVRKFKTSKKVTISTAESEKETLVS